METVLETPTSIVEDDSYSSDWSEEEHKTDSKTDSKPEKKIEVLTSSMYKSQYFHSRDKVPLVFSPSTLSQSPSPSSATLFPSSNQSPLRMERVQPIQLRPSALTEFKCSVEETVDQIVSQIMERIIQDEKFNAWKKDMVTDFLSEFKQVVKTCQK